MKETPQKSFPQAIHLAVAIPAGFSCRCSPWPSRGERRLYCTCDKGTLLASSLSKLVKQEEEGRGSTGERECKTARERERARACIMLSFLSPFLDASKTMVRPRAVYLFYPAKCRRIALTLEGKGCFSSLPSSQTYPQRRQR